MKPRKQCRSEFDPEPEIRVMRLEFETPGYQEWNPDDPLDCAITVTANIGDESGACFFGIHVCTPASIKRMENKRWCFLIDEYAGEADLIRQLDQFIAEKLRGCTGDPFRVLGKLWWWEYGKYDSKGQLVG